jgi:hypothetical protein
LVSFLSELLLLTQVGWVRVQCGRPSLAVSGEERHSRFATSRGCQVALCLCISRFFSKRWPTFRADRHLARRDIDIVLVRGQENRGCPCAIRLVAHQAEWQRG